MTSFRDNIAAFYRNSKGTKRKVAEFFLLNANEAAFMNAEDIATRVGVSPSSVTRCVADMGFAGYYDFLAELRDDVRRGMAPKDRLAKHIGEENGEISGFRESLENDSRNMESIISLNSAESMNEVIDALSSAKRIWLFSSRSSFPTLSLFALILSRIRTGISLLTETDGLLPEQLVEMEAGDVYFATNLPRYTRIVCDCTQYAKEVGCKVIVLTDNPDSPMMPFADISLFVPYDSYSFFNSHIASLALYNAIATVLSLKMDESSLARLERHDALVKRFNPLLMQKND